MPDRLASLKRIVQVRRPVPKPVRAWVNDNAGIAADGLAAEPPEPEWHGPGTIVSLGVQDGRHRLGAVRAAAQGSAEDPESGTETLLRLLAHYGVWMGFQGQAEPIHTGQMRRLSPPGPARGRIEYRLDLRRISRDTQSLTADGTILLDGQPVAVLDGVSIVFRPVPGSAVRSWKKA